MKKENPVAQRAGRVASSSRSRPWRRAGTSAPDEKNVGTNRTPTTSGSQRYAHLWRRGRRKGEGRGRAAAAGARGCRGASQALDLTRCVAWRGGVGAGKPGAPAWHGWARHSSNTRRAGRPARYSRVSTWARMQAARASRASRKGAWGDREERVWYRLLRTRTKHGRGLRQEQCGHHRPCGGSALADNGQARQSRRAPQR